MERRTDCPDAADLFEFALGKQNKEIEAHLEVCLLCKACAVRYKNQSEIHLKKISKK